MAELVHVSGFLAVFAAGLALRAIERKSTSAEEPEEIHQRAAAGSAEEIATDPEKAPSYMASAVLGFNEQIERFFEFGVVLLVGGMLSARYLPGELLWFLPLLIVGIRPLAAWLGLLGAKGRPIEKLMISFFGIRGVASIYYLAHAIERGLPENLAERLAGFTLWAVAASALVYGVAVTPMMKLYERRTGEE